jgi:hypothetical protein
MSENDSWRVESHLDMVGKGLGSTPEKIEELELRRAQFERSHRAPPKTPFGEVFAAAIEKAGVPATAANPDEKPEKPSGRPAAQMSGAYQRELVEGDEALADEKIVIKG